MFNSNAERINKTEQGEKGARSDIQPAETECFGVQSRIKPAGRECFGVQSDVLLVERKYLGIRNMPMRNEWSTYNLIRIGFLVLASGLLISACGDKPSAKPESGQSEARQSGTGQSEAGQSGTGQPGAVQREVKLDKDKGADRKNELPTVPIVEVKDEKLDHALSLPGELLAYQDVPIHAKVEGYIKWIGVDRGSFVKRGQKLITIFCPELNEKEKEGAAKLSAAESDFSRAQATEDATKSKMVEAQSRLDADQLTYQRLSEACKTPGAVAQNEVDLQQKAVESDKARVESIRQEVTGAHNLVIAEHHNVNAASQVLKSLKDMTAYLTVKAPFDGVITERNVHEGSIVAIDAARNALPLLRIQQKDVLRLVVAVPEDAVSGTKIGEKFAFTVPAFVGKKFFGIVARPAYALDNKTRTMPVELSVNNGNAELDPGMFATVFWRVTRPDLSMLVPAPAVDADLQGTYVIRVKNNMSERVEVQRGMTMGNNVEISGDLHKGDFVALKATDELKTGTHLTAKLANDDDIKKASKHTASGGE